MKLITWNINGLRSMKSPMKPFLDELEADIICFQETKITRDQLDSDLAIVDGYSSYFSFSQARQGYSGVATYCRDTATPIKSQEGLFHLMEQSAGVGKLPHYGELRSMFTDERIIELDKEGRTIITQHEFKSGDDKHEKIAIINVYCPRADPEKPERLTFKLDFYKALTERARSILESGCHVIICGDINTSHRRIDHCDPDGPELFYDNPCREWMDKLLFAQGDDSLLKQGQSSSQICCDSNSGKHVFDNTTGEEPNMVNQNQYIHFVDSFRYSYPTRKDAFTCWSTLKGCRQTNYGTRIDYIFANSVFHKKYFNSCDIYPEIHGSDHCPVKAVISIEIKPAQKCPPICTKYMTEFKGRQQTLSRFLTQKTVSVTPATQPNVSNVFGKRKHENTGKGNIKQRKISFFTNSVKKQTNVPTKTNKFLDIGKPFEIKKNSSETVSFWKSVLKGPGPAPPCSGHDEPSLLRTVKKEGANFGKQFYVCCRPEGHKTNPEARCSFFQWKK